MKLSIVTINLNNHEGLTATFDSIVSQTYQDFEYIVVDGLSNDGSQEIAKATKRINKLICEKDAGVYDAMNKGIKIASGTYILFLNSGDGLHEKTTLEKIIGDLDLFDIIYGDLFFEEKERPHVYNYPPILTFDFLHKASLGHPATFIKRQLFADFGYYDQSYKIAADWVFFMNVIVKQHVKTKHVAQVISNFNMEGMSSMQENMSAIFAERRRYLEGEFPLFLDDYQRHDETAKELKRIKSAKGFRWLKALGVKKFQ